jgi:hypothetical protein
MAKNSNQQLREDIFDKMWSLSGSLNGIGALLQQQAPNASYCYNHDELFGLGQLLKLLSDEISIIEDTLRCEQSNLSKKVPKNKKKS